MLELSPEAIFKKSKRAVGKEIGGATGPVSVLFLAIAPLSRYFDADFFRAKPLLLKNMMVTVMVARQPFK
jgi:hypothetical protein